MLTLISSFDHSLQHWINEVAISPFLDHLMAAMTSFSAWRPIFILVIVGALIFGKFRMRVMLLCLALALGVTDGLVVRNLKHLVMRPRPFQAQAGIRQVHLVPASPQLTTMITTPQVSFSEAPREDAAFKAKELSFPSAHAANVVTCATVLCLFYRRWRWLYITIALTVIYSRLYTGVHWPSDVLAGACIGIVVGTAVVRLANRAWKAWGGTIAPALAKRHPSLL